MATNNFKPFATGAGANVTSQADYEALSALLTGFQAGKASSAQINKALRQGSTMAAMLGQFISSAGMDAIDNGNAAVLLNNFLSALTTNLSLGNASKRNVGSGANQVPDMSLFQSGQGWQKLPSGTIIQQGTGQAGKLGTPSTIILPVPFTDVSISQVVACYDNPMSGLAVLPAFATRVNSGGTTFDLMHSSSTTATIYCRWIAVGR